MRERENGHRRIWRRIVALGRRATLWLQRTVSHISLPVGAFGVVIVLALYAFVLAKLLDHYARPTTFAERKDLLGTLATFLAGGLALLSVYPAWRTFRITGRADHDPIHAGS